MSPVGTDTGLVAAVLAEAFNDLWSAEWIAPDPAARLRAIECQFAMLAAHAVEHGGIVTSTASDGTLEGAVVWFDHTKQAPPPIADYERRLREAAGPHYERYARLDEVLEEHHPEAPHNYVALVGVRESLRGRGIATAMLRRHHEALDRDGVPAYLEAVSPRTAELYATVGYERMGDPFHLEPGDTGFHPMWREPRLCAAEGPGPGTAWALQRPGAAVLERSTSFGRSEE